MQLANQWDQLLCHSPSPLTMSESAFIRTKSKVLSRISWHTNLILGLEELYDSDFHVCSLNQWALLSWQKRWPKLPQAFSTKVHEVDNELTGNSIDIKAARKVLQIDPGLTNNINEAHLYKTVNRILAYRILDVCQWIKKNESSLQSTSLPALDGQYKDLLDKPVGIDTSSFTLKWLPSIFLESSKNGRLVGCSNVSQGISGQCFVWGK